MTSQYQFIVIVFTTNMISISFHHPVNCFHHLSLVVTLKGFEKDNMGLQRIFNFPPFRHLFEEMCPSKKIGQDPEEGLPPRLFLNEKYPNYKTSN